MARGRPAKKGTRSRVKEEVPDVYRELLADAVSSSPSQMSADGRAIKRRRVGGRIVAQSDEETAIEKSNHSNKTADDSDLDDLFEDVRPSQQKIIQTESDDSADSDIDWEEVEPRDRVSQQGTPEPEEVESGGFSLVLRDGDEHKAASSVKSKRKPMTTEDKKLRLDIHKMHVCCLMAHVFIRNHWCNDEKVYVGR